MTTIGISAGDPAGIGLEVTLKALPSLIGRARWILFSGRRAFERNYARFGNNLPYRSLPSLQDVTDEALLFVIETREAADVSWGEARPEAGQSAIACLETASDAALRGDIQALVTAPVRKASVGTHFKGQTEFLANRAGVDFAAMSFFAPTFKVVLATTHLPLREALSRISTDQYVELIHFVDREFRRFGLSSLRIAVAGINPHAGEDGMFGREDLDILTPAVERCAREGISVSGPHSPDSLYYRAHTGEFDVVIAPYHDQGLIPVKLIAHGQSVNVTLGLPYVRTSPDHGTALSIAGQGVADPSGMRAAMECALDLVSRELRK